MPSPLLARFAHLYEQVIEVLQSYGQHVFLLAVRLAWGSQFALTGWGKLTNIEGVTAFFTSLGIPMPGINAYVASTTELAGGLLLLIGLGGRLVPLPLIFTMLVAYATSDIDAIRNFSFTEPDPLFESAPFLFLLSSLIIWVFGPGKISADELIGRWWKKQNETP